MSLSSARSEDCLVMNIGYCLDASTLILKGSIVDEDGAIQVEAVLKGEYPSNLVTFHELRDINTYGDYSPEIKVGWEVIIFLKTSEQNELVPVMHWDNLPKALGLGVSTLWFKDGNVFYADKSPADKVVFLRQGEQQNMESMIIEHVRNEEAITQIEKYKSCRKKFNRLEKLYEESNFDEMIFDAMLKTECGDEILAFSRPIVLDSQYTYMQKKMLPGFFQYGQQQIVPDLEAMFDREFRFWKAYIGVPERRLWWRFDSTLQMRFAIFGTWMQLMIAHKLGDWEHHANEVMDYFSRLEAYQANTGYGKLNETVQHWLHN